MHIFTLHLLYIKYTTDILEEKNKFEEDKQGKEFFVSDSHKNTLENMEITVHQTVLSYWKTCFKSVTN